MRERKETMTELLRSHPVFDSIQWATISCERCHSTGQDGEHIPPPIDDEIPFVRRWLGDKPYRAFKIPAQLFTDGSKPDSRVVSRSDHILVDSTQSSKNPLLRLPAVGIMRRWKPSRPKPIRRNANAAGFNSACGQ